MLLNSCSILKPGTATVPKQQDPGEPGERFLRPESPPPVNKAPEDTGREDAKENQEKNEEELADPNEIDESLLPETEGKPKDPETVAPEQDTAGVSPPPKKESPDGAKPVDAVDAGIRGIFRDFGYSGDIEVPVKFRDRVAYYIRYFSTDPEGSGFYRRSMARAAKYLPMIESVLKEKHLPLSLAYLPLVESGYIPRARSRAGAVGMWQFMRGTARMYGLNVSRRTDERTHPAKATRAAAEYLNDLLAMFGLEDPFLGICAYNAGEGKILRSLRKISYKERSFWTLVKKNLLRAETDEYIPRFIAGVLMVSHSGTIAGASRDVAPAAVDSPEDSRIISSFHVGREDLGGAGNIANGVSSTESPTAASPRQHRVGKGDTLYSIARGYGVPLEDLKAWNRLRSNHIRPGQTLQLYSPGGKSRKSKSASSTRRSKKSASRGYKLVYTVNYSDSLARIALYFKGVTTRAIMRWNGLRRTRIYPRQKLTLYLPRAPRKVKTYTVRRGDSAARIARKFGSRVEFVLSLNDLLTDTRLQPGQKLKIYLF